MLRESCTDTQHVCMYPSLSVCMSERLSLGCVHVLICLLAASDKHIKAFVFLSSLVLIIAVSHNSKRIELAAGIMREESPASTRNSVWM